MKKFILLLIFFCNISFAQSQMDIFNHSKIPLLTWQKIIESRWKTIDHDKNNLLDKSEIQQISFAFRLLSFKYFSEIDSNHDGFISHEELASYSKEQEDKQKEKINRKWNQLDTNGDYQISLEEAQTNKDIKDNFSTIDTNHDSFISPEEFIVFYNKTLSSKLGLD